MTRNALLLWGAALALLGLLCAAPALRRRHPAAWWYLIAFPLAVLRVRLTWRRLTGERGLTVTRRPSRALVGDLIVKGEPLRPVPPRLGIPRPRRDGWVVPVHLHAGQTPDAFVAAADAFAHTWRVHAVRVDSPGRGLVRLRALAVDPFTQTAAVSRTKSAPVGLVAPLTLRAVVGTRENGASWVIDLRAVPHWLIVGATRSGKSTLLAALVAQLAPQPVALVGIDCKGGMELALFEDRLSILATTRREAAQVLQALVDLALQRMTVCRFARVRSIWELPDALRPVPVVVVVDEVAELYLIATRAEKDEANETSTALLRLGQLGAALGIHLVVAGQRVGSDLGPGITALRAQLAGRVCHRVSDPGTAEMALGDLNPDAVDAAQAILPTEAGVAIVTGDGGWTRARSTHIPPDDARKAAAASAGMVPNVPELAALRLGGDA